MILVAEQRLGRAIERQDQPGAVDHHDAVSRGVEDRAQLADLGFGGAQRDLGVAQPLGGRGADQRQHQRALALPGHRIEAALAGERVAGARRDREGLAGAVDAVERAGCRIDHEALQPARGRDGGDVGVAGPFEEGAVRVEQRIVAMDQHADRQALQHGELRLGVFLRGFRADGGRREGARSGFGVGHLRRARLCGLRRRRRCNWRSSGRRGRAVLQGLADLHKGRALDRRKGRAFVGGARKRHHVLRRRHDREDRTLRLLRRLCWRGRNRRCFDGLCSAVPSVPCARRRGTRRSRDSP